jgi:N-acetylmuramic acid 6-phosphate etherase
LAELTDFEASIYAASGLVTYFPDNYMIDIFTDTTERSPTFMLPPFRSTLDTENPVSWAFVKDPMRKTESAWLNLLGRSPYCIAWTSNDYRQLGATQRIVDNPPEIDVKVLSTYCVGSEPDASRTEQNPNVAVAFCVGGEEANLSDNADWNRAFDKIANQFDQRAAILIGSKQPQNWNGKIFFVETDLPQSPLEIFSHLAIKLALNNVSSATMGKLGRLSGNWMAHVSASNKKLIDRSIRLVSELAEVDYKTACYALFQSLEELNALPEANRKTISPAAYTVERLIKNP